MPMAFHLPDIDEFGRLTQEQVLTLTGPLRETYADFDEAVRRVLVSGPFEVMQHDEKFTTLAQSSIVGGVVLAHGSNTTPGVAPLEHMMHAVFAKHQARWGTQTTLVEDQYRLVRLGVLLGHFLSTHR